MWNRVRLAGSAMAMLNCAASPDEVGVLPYAPMSESARDVKVGIRQPVSWLNAVPASVILRPVPIGVLATLVRSGASIAVAFDKASRAKD
ncbi:hypothetical protein [Paraburkholderia sp. HP33-1]|uniref:hypothetical protein n=1 Tax=Paraburkholderia sp. HP33-1 TaxID=2883243 RepID=UPI001F360AB1|nr:hypothetical protein [Paraburkholderia sp. HP33-1]